MTDLFISTMSEEELGLAVEWAAAEGWNPGRSDAACFHAANPSGFLIGRLDGEPVATISAVRYPTGFAFLGLYIVRPDVRGRGHGRAIWSAAMARMASDVVGLDGVVEQQANYAASGFALAHRSIRFEGRAGRLQDDLARDRRADVGSVTASIDVHAVQAYDRDCFGAPRPGFLAAWLSQPGAQVAGVEQAGRLRGYGVLRPCRSGHKVGPLFADDRAVAEALLSDLVSGVAPDQPVYLDVPEPNAAGVALAESLGMVPVFETARMYRGGTRVLPLERIFGITTFELG